ncbi:MAG: mechanosensitive ion channel family protein [Burkholderiales bacterium]
MDWILQSMNEITGGGLWAFCIVLVRVIAIITVALIALRLARRASVALEHVAPGRHINGEDAKRIETMAQVIRYGVTVIVTLVAGMLILSEFGISIAPILGAAGVAGIALGFGSQSLIKDYFTGFCILLENQIRQGDVVEAGGKSGRVERITLRHLQLRDYEGNVHYVPNGLITTVTNLSRDYAYARVDVDIAGTECVDRAFEVMRKVSDSLRATDAFAERILADIEIAGIERWDDSGVTLRARIKVVPLEQWSVRREFIRQLKVAFEIGDIAVPNSRLTLYQGIAPERSAHSSRVSGIIAGEPAAA